jgi:phosphopantetheinyl transferase (holo-ACP synthase)
MNFPFTNCIVDEQLFPVSQLRELLLYPHLLTCVILDLELLGLEVGRLGEKQVVAGHLTEKEQELFSKLTSTKRQREWLGGRFAARHAAARLIGQRVTGPKVYQDLGIDVDGNSRPFIIADKNNSEQSLPDISISHSGSLAAAMAVTNGYCGIDIQQITQKVLKVRERFCSDTEMLILQEAFSASSEIFLTKLWAAKEALRKASNLASLPGFTELQLTEITDDISSSEPRAQVFMFNSHSRVAVTSKGEYVLALTARDDTVT